MHKKIREQFMPLGALLVAVVALVFVYQGEKRVENMQAELVVLKESFEKRLGEIDAHLDRTERHVRSLQKEGFIEGDDFSSFSAEALSATVMILDGEKEVIGSGFFVDSDGIVATAAHVIDSIDGSFGIQTSNKSVFLARVVAHDSASDIALLDIEGNNFPTLSLGFFENVEVGEKVGIAGFNKGFSQILVHQGVLSSRIMQNGIRRISVNAFVNKGNSGGPIFSGSTGRVIGIVSARQTDVPTEKFITVPPGYSSGFAIGGLDPVKFNVDLYNETVQLVGDVSQVGIGFGTAADHIRELQQEIK